MKNNDIRQKAQKANVKLWQIAEKLSVTDSTFSKMLRKELSTEQKEKIFAIIATLETEDNRNDR